MKRSSIAALAVGLLVSAIIIVLHATHLIAPLEGAVMTALGGSKPPTKVVGPSVHYLLIILLSMGVAWLVITSSRSKNLYWPLAILGIELLVISWVCQLYQVSFQPLPSVFAVALGFAAANGYTKYGQTRSSFARDLFGGRLSEEQIARVATGELPFNAEAKSYETTAVVCDIANKHDLAEECRRAVDRDHGKIHRPRDRVLHESGRVHRDRDGEGIVALFGFPAADARAGGKSHAARALAPGIIRETARGPG